jgi:hypothetical protein
MQNLLPCPPRGAHLQVSLSYHFLMTFFP